MFTSKKINLWVNLSPIIISFCFTLFIIIFGSFLPPRLPIFYSISWGDNQLGNHQQFLIIPAVISLIALLNLIISWQLHPSQIFFKRVLYISSMLITLILTVTFLKIILIFI